jgi:hypothetical protein
LLILPKPIMESYRLQARSNCNILALFYRLTIGFLLITINCFAQTPSTKNIDSLENKIKWYNIQNQSPKLFVHFDKTIYSNNDKVWFTAYLLNLTNHQDYKTLSVALVSDNDHSLIQEDQFVIRQGIAFGNTIIPDSIPPGNYSFIVTTNRLKNNRPEVVFKQPITIKTDSRQEYGAVLNPLDTAATLPAQKVMLTVNFINQPVQPPGAKTKVPPAVMLSYYVGYASKPVIRGFGKTEDNKYLFNIPSKLLSPGNNWLHVQLQYKGDIKELSIALPITPRPAIVSFYPEGGNMVNNIQSVIGWEVKNTAGKPLGTSALLYRDKKVIDTIKTNSYGLGSFQLRTEPGISYFVKLYKQDSLYKLPPALAHGPAISLPKALVNDTLIVNIKSIQHEKLYLVGHNYKQTFFITPVIMSGPDKKIKLIIKDIPKGLTQLTLTDSLGHPFAERLFFAHYDKRSALNINTDKKEYTTRQKVTVRISLNNNQPESGFVSIACVQANRIELKKRNDIESYFYLKHDLEDIPVRETYLENTDADKQFLENILLIKGWSRYKWTDVLKAKSTDTLISYSDLVFKGNVTKFKGKAVENDVPLNEPVSLVNINNPLKNIITDKTGSFALSDEDLFTDTGKKINFIVKGPDPKNYKFLIINPYNIINELLAKQLELEDYSTAGQENSKYMQIPDNEHAIHLKEVKIKDNNDDSFFGEPGGNDNNKSGAITATLFTNGQFVSGKTWVPRRSAKYIIPEFKGIYEAREFYPEDYSKTNASEPEYLSTIYWKHIAKISSATATELSFYTGDITGKFKIVIQGITDNDVVYGETVFNVINKQ